MAGRTHDLDPGHPPRPPWSSRKRPGGELQGQLRNLLFFWDVLFGTAKITRTYPESYGVENLPETSLGEQLAWPLFGQIPEEQAGEGTVTEAA